MISKRISEREDWIRCEMGLMQRIQQRIETTAQMHSGSRKAVGGLKTMERLENLEELLEKLEAPSRSERFGNSWDQDSQGQDFQGQRAEGFRMRELEAENLRLNRLVAELLLKNQQLRETN
jgi:hypothetical protein